LSLSSMTTQGQCSGNNCTTYASKIRTRVAAAQNPFADLDSITPPGSTLYTGSASQVLDKTPAGAQWTASNFKPGVYRGHSTGSWSSSSGSNTLTTYKLASRSSLTLTPGTYYFHNANLVVESNSTLTCDGCTFVFTGDSPSKVGTLSIKSNSSLTLKAPSLTSGDPGLGGMLFVRAGGTTGQEGKPAVDITSNSSFTASGGQYFGNSYTRWGSNSSNNADLCNGMVTGTLDMSSTSSTTMSVAGCATSNWRTPQIASEVFLVE
jgi:hypothetical protein